MAHNYTVFQYFAVLVLLKYENSVILTVPEYHLYAAVTHAEALNNQYCSAEVALHNTQHFSRQRQVSNGRSEEQAP